MDLDVKLFGLQINIMLHFTRFGLKSFGQQVIITVIRYFTGVRLENIWTTNLDYNFYILQDLNLKMFGLWICISIVIYRTGFGLKNTWTANLN